MDGARLRKCVSTENKYKENLLKAMKMSDGELAMALENAPDCWRGLGFNDYLYDRVVLPLEIEIVWRGLRELCDELELDDIGAVLLYLLERWEIEFETPVGLPDWLMGGR